MAPRARQSNLHLLLTAVWFQGRKTTEEDEEEPRGGRGRGRNDEDESETIRRIKY